MDIEIISYLCSEDHEDCGRLNVVARREVSGTEEEGEDDVGRGAEEEVAS